jgi:wyosine [tRNA(Phe)-imidazoG37] synthetase (radical SAM superfamily)
MSGILFDEIVFGPVRSRRFGVSLGMNLLPLDSKLCSFDCIYCECGLTKHEPGHKPELYKASRIRESLEQRLRALKEGSLAPDNITFAGNGEPTLHPEFDQIIADSIELRDAYFPQAKITVLSNGTSLKRDSVRQALMRVDNNVLKLDAGTDRTFRLINRPLSPITLEEIVERLAGFTGRIVVQTLFIRGEVEGEAIDNTTPEEVDLWLGHLKRIKPELVMLYPIARRTPFASLEKISPERLHEIALRVEATGLKAEVFS